MPRYNQYGYRFKQQPNKMLSGDNLALFLNSDPAVVEKYRQQYRIVTDGTVSAPSAPLTEGIEEDVSLRGLGNAVLSSKIYRVKSTARCKALRRRMQASMGRLPPATTIDCIEEGDESDKTDATTVSLCLLTTPFSGLDPT